MNASTSPSPLSSAARKPELVIGGITPFTTIDFPGRLAAVLYTQGCAWSCRYCHNAHLRPFLAEGPIRLEDALSFVRSRKGLLDGVVFCGGEPTAQAGLPEAMRRVKEMGFQTGLHTAGMYPERLRNALVFCDWVGMDVKAPFASYEKITGKPDGEAARASLRILLESGVDHEVRATVHEALLSEAEVLELAGELSRMGVKKFVLQVFQPSGCRDAELTAHASPPEGVAEKVKTRLSCLFSSFAVRR